MLDKLRNGFHPRAPLWAVGLLVFVFGVAAVAIVLMALLPGAVVPDTPDTADRYRLAAEASIRATIVQGIAGFVVLSGLGLTARSLYLSRETHLTDRLAKAVDQLGHDKPEVRIGGVYSLQRLAVNSRVDRTVIDYLIGGYLQIHATSTQSSSAELKGK